MKNIYCISGLGADERIFKKLKVDNANLIHVPWPEYDIYDEMSCYAQKVSALIPEDNPIIIGLSFGGMMAVEIAKFRPVKKIFLISSAKGGAEILDPGWVIKKLIVSEIIPAFVYTIPNTVMYNLFGAYTEEEKELLKAILKDSDGAFLKWALKNIATWQNTVYPEDAIHIHGTADKIIPPDNITADYWIEGGTHMMVYNRADEIGQIISNDLPK